MKIWYRIGDGDDYHDEDTIRDACERLIEAGAGLFVSRVSDMGVGIETENYRGQNFISLYWGDEDGELASALDDEDIEIVKQELEDAEEDEANSLGTIPPTSAGLDLADRLYAELCLKQEAIAKRELSHCERRDIDNMETRYYLGESRYAIVCRDLVIRWFEKRGKDWYVSKDNPGKKTQ